MADNKFNPGDIVVNTLLNGTYRVVGKCGKHDGCYETANEHGVTIFMAEGLMRKLRMATALANAERIEDPKADAAKDLPKFKVGDRVKGMSNLHNPYEGTIVEYDGKHLAGMNYLVQNESGPRLWMLDDTLELVEEPVAEPAKEYVRFTSSFWAIGDESSWGLEINKPYELFRGRDGAYVLNPQGYRAFCGGSIKVGDGAFLCEKDWKPTQAPVEPSAEPEVSIETLMEFRIVRHSDDGLVRVEHKLPETMDRGEFARCAFLMRDVARHLEALVLIPDPKLV